MADELTVRLNGKKHHLFTYVDVLRIVRVVEPHAPVGRPGASTELLAIISTLFAVQADLLQAFSRLGWDIIPDQLLVEAAGKTIAFIGQLVTKSPASAAAAIISAVISGLGDLLGYGSEEPEPVEQEVQ